MLICIMNHYKRDISAQVEKLEAIGWPYKVFTDYSDYKDTRDENRYKGLKDNYMSIIRYQTEHKWKLILHDDMSITSDLFAKIEYVLRYSFQKNIVSFFHPTNKKYREAVESGHHVVKVFSNFWLPCHAFPKVLEADLINFYDNNEVTLKRYSEDGVISRYMSFKGIPLYVVTPTLSQHLGIDSSLFGNPRVCGGNERTSFSFNEDFDVTEVDWNKEFNRPFQDLSKRYFDKTDNLKW
jgi:hypothetical protein